MEADFTLEILTPGRPLLRTQVSEIVLPAHDGEAGILAGHENFIGLLGTGALKIVKNSDDYWFMVSSGVFEVLNGKVTILAEVGEEAKDIIASLAEERLRELEPQLVNVSSFAPEFPLLKVEVDRAKARLEVYRRTELVN